MTVLHFDEVENPEASKVGGKAVSLCELHETGLPVPPGFVITTDTYERFIEAAGIEDDLRETVAIDSADSDQLERAETEARRLIHEAEVPDDIGEEIRAELDRLGQSRVAVRSSASAEDRPDASFAGQQDSYLNVTDDDLLDRIKDCWSSIFTQRAIYYRDQMEYDHETVAMAVVVQRMVDAEKSGVMFTRHPSTGAEDPVIEAAWGLGEAVVSGSVSPDNYVVDRTTGELLESSIATKQVMTVRDSESGETVDREVPESARDEQVLDVDEIKRLVEFGAAIEEKYGQPQDIEWAIQSHDGPGSAEGGAGNDRGIFILQSRPITTLGEPVESTPGQADEPVANGAGATLERPDEEGEPTLSGIGASPGYVSGPVQIVQSVAALDTVDEGDVLVTEMTTPDMVPAMKRAAAIVTDQGGMTSHAAIVSRELGVPAVVGTERATADLERGQVVTVDGEKGRVHPGEAKDAQPREPIEDARPKTPVKPMTGTRVKVNVSIPEAAHRAAATGADGVGLLRLEHLILSSNKTPARFIEEHGDDEYVDEIVEGVRSVAEEFYPRPVRVRTLDAPTDEFRQLDGGEEEPTEHNPMLGLRGIRRSLETPTSFSLELEAFAHLFDEGYDNLEVMFPLVSDASEVTEARRMLDDVGVDTAERDWGIMIETPASALCIGDLVETGIDFVSFGTNDLTQYTLAVDRNNEHVADRYDEWHPAVRRLMAQTIRTCRANDVDTGICGQAASDPRMVRLLVDEGITSVSANIDAVRDVQHEVKRVEQQLILDSIRSERS